jgi:hypothetical protein
MNHRSVINHCLLIAGLVGGMVHDAGAQEWSAGVSAGQTVFDPVSDSHRAALARGRPTRSR